MNDEFLTIMDIKEGVSLESLFPAAANSANYTACIVPIIAAGQRLGTFVLYKEKK